MNLKIIFSKKLIKSESNLIYSKTEKYSLKIQEITVNSRI